MSIARKIKRNKQKIEGTFQYKKMTNRFLAEGTGRESKAMRGEKEYE